MSRLSHRKISQIKLKIFTLLSQEPVSIRELASVIWSLLATFPAITYGTLCYRKLEILKIISLKNSKGNFEHKSTLPSHSRTELNWWLSKLDFHKRIITTEADLTIYTDASNLGWGADDRHNPTGEGHHPRTN